METDPRVVAVLAETLARQAAALHVVFMRTFRLLIKLRAAERSQKNLEIERTNY